jgi:hypothetical protein
MRGNLWWCATVAYWPSTPTVKLLCERLSHEPGAQKQISLWYIIHLLTIFSRSLTEEAYKEVDRASPSGLIRLEWWIQLVPAGSQMLQVARLRAFAAFPMIPSAQVSGVDPCWSDSGAPISVVPFHIHQHLLWQPLGVPAKWMNQHGEVGRIDAWFQRTDGGSPIGPFSLLAKFPQGDPHGIRPPVLLGLEFLLSYKGILHVPPPPDEGTIQIP